MPFSTSPPTRHNPGPDGVNEQLVTVTAMTTSRRPWRADWPDTFGPVPHNPPPGRWEPDPDGPVTELCAQLHDGGDYHDNFGVEFDTTETRWLERTFRKVGGRECRELVEDLVGVAGRRALQANNAAGTLQRVMNRDRTLELRIPERGPYVGVGAVGSNLDDSDIHYRGNYYSNMTTPPAAFAAGRDDQEILVVGCDWHRLEAIDVTTGATVARSTPTNQLFIGRCVATPDRTWLGFSTWGWSPVAVGATLSVAGLVHGAELTGTYFLLDGHTNIPVGWLGTRDPLFVTFGREPTDSRSVEHRGDVAAWNRDGSLYGVAHITDSVDDEHINSWRLEQHGEHVVVYDHDNNERSVLGVDDFNVGLDT